MRSDGRTDMTKLNSRYSQFGECASWNKWPETHLNKETSVLGCEGVFDEVVSVFSMDRGVEQLQLFYFFIRCSEDEDIKTVRNI
jgi:hypothetical protein